MRKYFLMAFAALSMTVAAQKVTPLMITLTDFNVDSLRALYLSEPIVYRAALEAVAKGLERDEAAIKAAKSELKVEQQHSKEKSKALKEAAKMTAVLEKLYEKEMDELKAMQKIVEKQQRTLTKQKELNLETRTAYMTLLDRQQTELSEALQEAANRSRSMMELDAQIQTGRSNLLVYDHQVTEKATDLAKLEAQLKSRRDGVKAELKAAKSLK